MRKFRKNVENFVCQHCCLEVVGDGYTNHCPQCLYSKHVDNNPGDRASQCGGLMTPVGIEHERASYVLTHRCKKCGIVKRNKVQSIDSPDAVVALAQTCAREQSKNL